MRSVRLADVFVAFCISRDGAVVRALASHQCGPGSNPGVDAICGLSLLLVLSFAPRGFSPGTPVSLSPQKPAFSNSNSTRNQVDEEPLCRCATSKPLFNLIYLFITIIHVYSLVFLSNMLQPIRIRLKTLSCFETNLYLRVFLRTHANKPVSDPQTKIICKETLLITVFVLYKLRNTCKLRLTGR